MPGVGPITYNGKEDVKKFPGMEQPAIMPPALSQAGRNYRDQFKNVIGFDPYNSAFGFVPNFSLLKVSRDDIIYGPNKGLANAYKELDDGSNTHADIRRKLSKGKFEGPLRRLIPGATARGAEEKIDREVRTAASEGGTIDVQGRLGILSLFGKTTPSATAGTSIGQLSVFNDLLADPDLNKKNRDILSKAPVRFNNIQVSSLENASEEIAKSRKGGRYSKFRKELNNQLVPVLSNLGKVLFPALGDKGASVEELKKRFKTSKDNIIPPGAEGEMFEATAKFATKKTDAFMEAIAGDFRAPFDFEEDSDASATFKNEFFKKELGLNPASLRRADAKRTATPSSIRSIIKKSYNRAVANMERLSLTELKKDLNLPYLDGKPSFGGVTYGAGKGQGSGKAKLKLAASEKKEAASGFIPNFALKAISDAIQREDRAGVRRDKIRVGYDRRLAASAVSYTHQTLPKTPYV